MEIDDEAVHRRYDYDFSNHDHPDGYSIGSHRVVLDGGAAGNDETGSAAKSSAGLYFVDTIIKTIIATLLIISIIIGISLIPIALFGHCIYTLFGWMYNKAAQFLGGIH
jgi:hypothetical protein